MDNPLKRYDISNALTIPGWMDPLELVWLAKQAQKYYVIVEIGSYLGRSTRALADNTPGHVIAIDDWKGPRDVNCDRENLLDKFLFNMQTARHKLQYLQMDYSEYESTPCLKEINPDMVFVDGSHEYVDVKRDIEFWKEELMVEGLLCGHDYFNFPGVNRAVRELVPSISVVRGTNIWCWIKC